MHGDVRARHDESDIVYHLEEPFASARTCATGRGQILVQGGNDNTGNGSQARSVYRLKRVPKAIHRMGCAIS